jgi:glycosyltransferase involved in cell wall biosynthesis
VIEDYQADPQRVTAIGGGVNFTALPEQAGDRAALSRERPPAALFIGKEFDRKGGDLLLRAFARVREELPQARLILLTNPDIPEGFSLEGVEQISPTWDRGVMTGLYERSDFLVLPSRLETWGDVLLEAMSFGLPCIGVSGQAMEEIIADQQTGIIVPPEDEGALARAMTRLYQEPGLRRKWGECGRERVESRFTWDRVAQNLEAPFQQAIADQNSEEGRMGVVR